MSVAITPVVGTDLNLYASVSFQANDVAPNTVNVHARIRDQTNGTTIAVGSVTLTADVTPGFGTISLVGQRVLQAAAARTYALEIGISGSPTCSVDVLAATPDTSFQSAAMIVENVIP